MHTFMRYTRCKREKEKVRAWMGWMHKEDVTLVYVRYEAATTTTTKSKTTAAEEGVKEIPIERARRRRREGGREKGRATVRKKRREKGRKKERQGF